VSSFELNRLLYDLRDPELRSAYSDDPAAVSDGYDLSPDELSLLTARDWSGLVDAGASVYILGNLGRVAGLSFAEIGACLRGETPAQMSAFLDEQSERVAPLAIVPNGAPNG
jgi:protocatechuate 4,5-dioxygenase alpha chain